MEALNLVAKSCGVTAQLSIGKDIDIARRVTSPPVAGDVTTSLHESPITSQHSVEKSMSLEVPIRRLFSVDSPIAISGFTRVQPV